MFRQLRAAAHSVASADIDVRFWWTCGESSPVLLGADQSYFRPTPGPRFSESIPRIQSSDFSGDDHSSEHPTRPVLLSDPALFGLAAEVECPHLNEPEGYVALPVRSRAPQLPRLRCSCSPEVPRRRPCGSRRRDRPTH